jgi:HEAT repeat protein
MNGSPATLASGRVLKLFLVLASLAIGEVRSTEPFRVEITSPGGGVLGAENNFSLLGIEQTLVARVTPSVEGAEFEWTVPAQAMRTYEHDIQRADRHRPIALTEKDRSTSRLAFFWTEPVDDAVVSVRVRKGSEQATASAAFKVRVPRDPNRDVYSYADHDPRRNPNGLSATYAVSRDHRNWHLGLKMTNGDTPVAASLWASAPKLVWGDLGYRDDPARLFGLDYNGSALLGWHHAFLDAYRAWRGTFHMPDLDTATPSGALLIPEYFKRVPDEKSKATSRLRRYVRMGEFQRAHELGQDLVHPWHNRGHSGIARTTGEPRMDDQAVSPPARDDFFYRWHTVVEEVGLTLAPDQAVVTTRFPEEGATTSDLSAVYVAFDRKVSAHAPAANTVQLSADKLTVNGAPARVVADLSADELPFVMYRFSGITVPNKGVVKVELTGTASYKGASWTVTLQPGPKPGSASTPGEFRTAAEKAFRAARARQTQDDIARVRDLLKGADADDHWVGYLFRIYPLTAEQGVPLLIGLLDHPSVHVQAHAIQTLQYRYPRQAAAAIPKLIELLNDPTKSPWWLREWTARALGEIGPGDSSVISALMTCLEKKPQHEPVNRRSIEALGRMGSAASAALPLLRKYVTSPDPDEQLAAYRAIGQIVNADPPSADDLRRLTSVDWKVADGGYAVFRAIQEAGPGAGFAVPALVETFRQEPPAAIKGMVIETLGKIKAADPAAYRVVVDALPARWGGAGDPPTEKFASDLAQDALARLTPLSEEAVPHLIKALKHPDPRVRYQAALAVRRFGPKGARAVPALVDSLKQADSQMPPHQIGAYLDALRGMGPAARSASDLLVGLLSERARLYRNQEKFYAHYLRAWLLLTIAETGVPAGARPYILDLLNNSDKFQAHGYATAARAAGALGPQFSEALPGLMRSLKPGFPDFPMGFDYFGMALGEETASCRLESLRALAKMGAQARPAVAIIARLADEEPDAESVVPPWRDEAVKTLHALQSER